MSDTTYWISLAVASVMIIGFVLCFIQNKAARFFIAVFLFFTAGSALLWVQRRAEERADARLEANRAVLRALDEEETRAAAARLVTTPTPAPASPAPAP